MANEPAEPVVDGSKADGAEGRGQARSRDEVALELMKFVAVTTGYGKARGKLGGFLRKAHKVP